MLLKTLVILFFSLQALSAAQTLESVVTFGSTGSDSGLKIAYDSDKNYYITGNFRGTVDFDPGAGIYNLSSNGSADIFFAKFDSLGALVWARSIGGINGESSHDIMLDPNGDVILSGYFNNTVDFDPTAAVFSRSASNTDGFFAKYDGDDGTLIWVRQIGGTQYDFVTGSDLDADGNIYVTGYMGGHAQFDPVGGTSFRLTNGGNDAYIAKYDNDGLIVWAYMIGGAGTELGRDVCVDASGNVYLVGLYTSDFDIDHGPGTTTLTHNASDDSFVAKFDSNGDFVWANTYSSASAVEAATVDTDASGNIYVSGFFSGTCDFDPTAGTDNRTSNGSSDIFVSKFTSAGSVEWVHTIGGSGGDVSRNVFVDQNNEIYIAGDFSGTVDFDPSASAQSLTSSGGTDAFIVRFDGDGEYQDAFKIGGTSNESASGIVSDSDRDLYIIGNYSGTVDFSLGAGTASHSSLGSLDVFAALYSQTFPPTLTTTEVRNITQISAKSGGSISDLGNAEISERGLVWGTNSTPTLGNATAGGYSAEGSGSSDFSSDMTDLSEGTRYYVRAYATNSAGTGYGQVLSFLTPFERELDGNQDGVLDENQSHVSTFYSYNNASLITVISPVGTTLQNVASLQSEDETYLYPYGLVQFELEASLATVKILFHDAPTLNGFSYRKISSTDTYFSYAESNIELETYGSFTIPVVTLNLQDGGDGDSDGEINGTIVDPGGPGIPPSTIPLWDWWWLLALGTGCWLVWRRG